MSVLAIDIPNPIEPVVDAIGGVAGWGARKAAGAVLGPVGDAIAEGLANACDKIGREVLNFLNASSSVHLDTGWWASSRGARLTGVILGLALVFMLGFLLLALIQGMLSGDPGAMLRTAFVEVPLSIAATAVLATVAGALLQVTDEASNAVLSGVPEDLERFFSGFGTATSVVTHGFAGMIMLVLFLIGALLVWVELVVRSSLIYWLVAAAPLFAAARIWPVARGAWRKLVEIGCVLIFSKLAIALALALGAAALAGGGPKEGDLGTQVGTDLGGLLVGAALMLLASFTPFVLLRLLPIVEAAVIAQGVSRMPARASMTGMQMGYYAAGLERMASGGRRGSAAPSPPRRCPVRRRARARWWRWNRRRIGKTINGTWCTHRSATGVVTQRLGERCRRCPLAKRCWRRRWSRRQRRASFSRRRRARHDQRRSRRTGPGRSVRGGRHRQCLRSHGQGAPTVSTQLADGRLYTLSPRDKTGFLGLSGRQVIVIGSAVVLGVILASQAGRVSLGIWPFLAALVVSFLRVGGVPIVDAAGPGLVHALRSVRHRNRWSAATQPSLTSPGGPAADTTRPLPPPLDTHRVIEVDGARYHPSTTGSTVAVAHDPVHRTYAATVRTTGVGGEPFALTEPSHQEHLLDKWGDALAAFCQERCPVAWVRWAESAMPADSDEQLAYLDEHGIDDPADPAVASYRAVLEAAGPLAMRHEVLVTVAVGAQRVPAGRRALAIGDDTADPEADGRMNREAACIDTLLSHLRLFVERLDAAGLLVSNPLSPTELDAALAVRMSPDTPPEAHTEGRPPSLAARLRAWKRYARLARSDRERWTPSIADLTWRSWVVDGVHHRAFHVAEWPRLELRAAWMAPLLTWGRGRRTVAVLMEPVPLRASQRAIERQATKLASDRAHRESKGFRVPAQHRRATRAVEEREEELVAGFAELEYAGVVCLSAPSARELERRSAELVQLAAGCGVGLEPVPGRHDLAVAACLPTAHALAKAWVA